MTRHEEMKLMTALQEIIGKLMRSGSTTTAAIFEMLIREYPDICERHKDRLFREAVANLSRRVMKRAADRAGTAQISLPLKLRTLKGQLPSHICLPPPAENREEEEVAVDEEFIWLPLEDSTFRQVGFYLQHLRTSIVADQKKYKVTNRAYQFLRPYMDNDEHRDEPIGPMLAEIVAAEAEKRR